MPTGGLEMINAVITYGSKWAVCLGQDPHSKEVDHFEVFAYNLETFEKAWA